MQVDKRTFIIVTVIVAIALPIIIFVFRKSFIPIILSIRNTITAAALTNSGTGVPKDVIDFFTKK